MRGQEIVFCCAANQSKWIPTWGSSKAEMKSILYNFLKQNSLGELDNSFDDKTNINFI